MGGGGGGGIRQGGKWVFERYVLSSTTLWCTGYLLIKLGWGLDLNCAKGGTFE